MATPVQRAFGPPPPSYEEAMATTPPAETVDHQESTSDQEGTVNQAETIDQARTINQERTRNQARTRDPERASNQDMSSSYADESNWKTWMCVVGSVFFLNSSLGMYPIHPPQVIFADIYPRLLGIYGRGSIIPSSEPTARSLHQSDWLDRRIMLIPLPPPKFLHRPNPR